MAHWGASPKILVICSWVNKLTGLPPIVRVDFEAALRAAVMHHRFDIAIYTETPGLSLARSETVIRAHAPRLELIAVQAVDHIAPIVATLAASRRS